LAARDRFICKAMEAPKPRGCVANVAIKVRDAWAHADMVPKPMLTSVDAHGHEEFAKEPSYGASTAYDQISMRLSMEDPVTSSLRATTSAAPEAAVSPSCSQPSSVVFAAAAC